MSYGGVSSRRRWRPTVVAVRVRQASPLKEQASSSHQPCPESNLGNKINETEMESYGRKSACARPGKLTNRKEVRPMWFRFIYNHKIFIHLVLVLPIVLRRFDVARRASCVPCHLVWTMRCWLAPLALHETNTVCSLARGIVVSRNFFCLFLALFSCSGGGGPEDCVPIFYLCCTHSTRCTRSATN